MGGGGGGGGDASEMVPVLLRFCGDGTWLGQVLIVVGILAPLGVSLSEQMTAAYRHYDVLYVLFSLLLFLGARLAALSAYLVGQPRPLGEQCGNGPGMPSSALFYLGAYTGLSLELARWLDPQHRTPHGRIVRAGAVLLVSAYAHVHLRYHTMAQALCGALLGIVYGAGASLIIFRLAPHLQRCTDTWNHYLTAPGWPWRTLRMRNDIYSGYLRRQVVSAAAAPSPAPVPSPSAPALPPPAAAAAVSGPMFASSARRTYAAEAAAAAPMAADCAECALRSEEERYVPFLHSGEDVWLVVFLTMAIFVLTHS